VRYGLGCLFRGRIGSHGGFPARLEGIDLSHEPLTGRESPLLPGLQFFVLAAQLDEPLGGVVLAALFIGLAFQFRYLELQPLAGSGCPCNVTTRTLKRVKLALIGSIQRRLRDPESDLAERPPGLSAGPAAPRVLQRRSQPDCPLLNIGSDSKLVPHVASRALRLNEYYRMWS
jgi:hypothetical protein